MKTENFEEKSYLKKILVADVRINLRIRSKMTNVKLSQQSEKAHARMLWKCSECGDIYSQSHEVWCPFFADLRGISWQWWGSGQLLLWGDEDQRREKTTGIETMAEVIQLHRQRRARVAWTSLSQAFCCHNSCLGLYWAIKSNFGLAWFLLVMKRRIDILSQFLLGKKYVLVILLDSCLKIFWKLNYLLKISW